MVLLDKDMDMPSWLIQMTKFFFLQEKEIHATIWGSKICLLKDGILIRNGRPTKVNNKRLSWLWWPD